MNQRFILSAQARQDLLDIKNYIACDSLDRAETFIRAIADRFQQLANFPNLGRSYEELFPGLRGLPISNYIIFYRQSNSGISIERILSGYRDLESMFSDGDR